MIFTQNLSKLLEMRSTEGAHLKSDLESRLTKIKGFLKKISEQAPNVVERYRDNLMKRLDAAGIELNLDDERLIKEIGIFADRCDISEEVTRLESHFAQCQKYFESDQAVGRPLDFLVLLWVGWLRCTSFAHNRWLSSLIPLA